MAIVRASIGTARPKSRAAHAGLLPPSRLRTRNLPLQPPDRLASVRNLPDASIRAYHRRWSRSDTRTWAISAGFFERWFARSLRQSSETRAPSGRGSRGLSDLRMNSAGLGHRSHFCGAIHRSIFVCIAIATTIQTLRGGIGSIWRSALSVHGWKNVSSRRLAI